MSPEESQSESSYRAEPEDMSLRVVLEFTEVKERLAV